jgi:hypothetical protein
MWAYAVFVSHPIQNKRLREKLSNLFSRSEPGARSGAGGMHSLQRTGTMNFSLTSDAAELDLSELTPDELERLRVWKLRYWLITAGYEGQSECERGHTLHILFVRLFGLYPPSSPSIYFFSLSLSLSLICFSQTCTRFGLSSSQRVSCPLCLWGFY